MSLRPDILWLIQACAAVAALPRVLPLVLLAKVTLPRWLLAWLGHVPVAVLAALLAPEVLLVKGAFAPANPALYAILPALAVAVLSRSLILTVLAGLGAYALLSW